MKADTAVQEVSVGPTLVRGAGPICCVDFLEHTKQLIPAVEYLGVRLNFLSAGEGYTRRKNSAHIWTC